MNVKQKCPPKETLVDFLLGKLEPPKLDQCEEHLNKCKPCGDTIRGLDASDTLVNLAKQSSLSGPQNGNQPIAKNSDSEQMVVKLLIDKLADLKPNSHTENDLSSVPSSARANEVISLLQPAKNPVGIGRISHYEVNEVLGVGATSVVFLAHDEQLHRDVALKVLRPSLGEEARQRFLNEARSAAALSHENVIAIYQVATEGHLAFMAQQWLPGETLAARLLRQPELSIEEISQISIDVAKGLAAAHRKNLIHRDIKPANIWVESERNRAIILDFGLVRVSDDDPQMTETGMIAGTPSFMSPEQTRGKDVDQRSDLFSLGCVMYRLCCGSLPFQAPNTLATLQSIQNENPPSPRSVNLATPSPISDLVMMLIDKEANQRPQSANQVALALENPKVMKQLLSTRSQDKPAVANPEVKRPSTWMRWLGAAVVLFGLGFMALNSPQIMRIVTNQGVLEIETDDPAVVVEVLEDGKVINVVDEKTEQKIEIKAGVYRVRPKGDENTYELSDEKITMKRGGKVIVSVTKLPQAESKLTKTQAENHGLNTDNQSTELTKRQTEKLEVERKEIVTLLSNLEAGTSAAGLAASIHEQRAKTLASSIGSIQSQLSKLTAEDSRIASFKTGEEMSQHVWALKQSGKILDAQDDLVAPIVILERYQKALQNEIEDLQSRLAEENSEYAKHKTEFTRIAKLQHEQKKLQRRLAEIDALQNIGPRLRPEGFESKAETEMVSKSKTLTVEPTFKNQPLDYWLSLLKRDRDSLTKKKAIRGINGLRTNKRTQEIADAYMEYMRSYSHNSSTYTDDGTSHRLSVGIYFSRLDPKIALAVALEEIPKATQKSASFLSTFPGQFLLYSKSTPERKSLLEAHAPKYINALLKELDKELGPNELPAGDMSNPTTTTYAPPSITTSRLQTLSEVLWDWKCFELSNQEEIVERLKRWSPQLKSERYGVKFGQYLLTVAPESIWVQDFFVECTLYINLKKRNGSNIQFLECLEMLKKVEMTEKTKKALVNSIDDFPTNNGNSDHDPRLAIIEFLSEIKVSEFKGMAEEIVPKLELWKQKVPGSKFDEEVDAAIAKLTLPESTLQVLKKLQGSWNVESLNERSSEQGKPSTPKTRKPRMISFDLGSLIYLSPGRRIVSYQFKYSSDKKLLLTLGKNKMPVEIEFKNDDHVVLHFGKSDEPKQTMSNCDLELKRQKTED